MSFSQFCLLSKTLVSPPWRPPSFIFPAFSLIQETGARPKAPSLRFRESVPPSLSVVSWLWRGSHCKKPRAPIVHGRNSSINKPPLVEWVGGAAGGWAHWISAINKWITVNQVKLPGWKHNNTELVGCTYVSVGWCHLNLMLCAYVMRPPPLLYRGGTFLILFGAFGGHMVSFWGRL